MEKKMDVIILKFFAVAAGVMTAVAAGVTWHLAEKAAKEGNWSQYWGLAIPGAFLCLIGIGISLFGYYL